MRILLLLAALSTAEFAQNAAPYPAHWWAPVNDPHKPDWEILPQAAKPGEVIVSKRNELGILSNFAATPFLYRGKRYASVEGFWQMMLYPEGPNDPRASGSGVTWRYTRDQVAQMTSFAAKDAGTLAEENMRRLHIDWVSFEGERIPYRSPTRGEHYRLIREAMLAKLDQNPKVRQILLSTGNLILRPDHVQEDNAPPEWAYYQIWMEIRSQLQQAIGASFQFSDAPDFAVAGVTDHTYVGGHASESNARTADNLAKTTASMKTSPGKVENIEDLRSRAAKDPGNATLQHALAEAAEAAGSPVEAVTAYQHAAELDPTEANLFDWGSELLSHGAAQPAVQVFSKALERYPESARLLLGEGVALFSGRDQPGAEQYFAKASDKNPADPRPYLFLCKLDDPRITSSRDFLRRMKRFADLHPESAAAHYAYATALWNRRSQEPAAAEQSEALLRKAIELDPALSEAHLQLGIVLLETKSAQSAIEQFQQALQINPQDQEAHYRLASAYRKSGQARLASQEMQTFQKLRQSDQPPQMQRFVVAPKTQNPAQ